MPRASAAQVGERLVAEMAEWPEHWRFDDGDVPLGRAIVAAMTPFLEQLASGDAAETSLRRHFGNAWLLGGEIVRAAHMDPAIRRLKGRQLLLRFVDEEGGPLLSGHSGESEQQSFDATCRKLWRSTRTSSAGGSRKSSRS